MTLYYLTHFNAHRTSSQVLGNMEVDVAEPPKPATEQRKRPRLDLSAVTGSTRERKRGKSMFGLVLGTLNQAKIEDKERNASEAVGSRNSLKNSCNHGASTGKKATTN